MKDDAKLVLCLSLGMSLMLAGGLAAQTPQSQEPPDDPQVKRPALLTAGPLKADPKDDELRKLLKARYNAALGELKDYYEAEDFASKHAVTRRSSADDWYGTWQRLVYAGLELYDKPADRISLLTQYLEVTKGLETIAQARFDHGRTRIGDLHRARFERLDAEIRLLKAKREADRGKDKR